MKKLVMLMGLLALPHLSFAAGIPVTDIPRLIMEYITSQVLMEQDQKVQKKKLQKLLEVLQEAKTIRARHTEITGIAEDVEAELRLVREVKQLKLHDLLRIVEKVTVVTNQLYATDVPYLEEYAALKTAIPGAESASRVYELLVGNASVYGELSGKAPTTYQENVAFSQQQAIRQYGVEVDAAKRALHTALSYGHLAKDLRDQALDLEEKVNREGRWSMRGIGDIFSDLFDLGEESAELDLGGFSETVKEWADDIRKKTGLPDNPLKNLFGGGDEDKTKQIEGAVKETVGQFDFTGIFETVIDLFSGSGGEIAGPAYSVEFEKEGLRMTTGERIEAQGIALDDLEQSVELQLEADRLVLDALTKTENQYKVDRAYQNALLRKSLESIQITP